MRPDIILHDVGLPGDDIAAARKIRKKAPDLRVVMLTVSENEDHVSAALACGVSGIGGCCPGFHLILDSLIHFEPLATDFRGIAQVFGSTLEHDLAVAHDVNSLRDAHGNSQLLLNQKH